MTSIQSLSQTEISQETPKLEPTRETEVEKIKALVKQTLGEKYYNIRRVTEGAQSYIFTANFGSEKGELRSIKVDKLLIQGRARSYRSRGCNTKRHIETLSRLPDSKKHHIVRMLDFYDVSTKTGDLAISVHDHIDGVTLEEKVKKQPLTLKEAVPIFANVLDALRYWTNNGYSHNDLNSRNILTNSEQGFVLDFCNARRSDESLEDLATSDRDWINDPLRLSSESNYQKPDIHAFGENLYYGLTGKRIFKTNYAEKTLESAETGESLLTQDGNIDLEKSTKTLDQALDKLPKYAKKLKKIIRRSVTLNEKLRYSSVDELAKEFSKVANLDDDLSHPRKRPMSRLKKWLYAGAAALGVAASVVSGIVGVNHANTKVETLEKKVEKYPVQAQWHGDGTITNNLVSLDVSISRNHEIIYGWDKFPNLLILKQGDEIEINREVIEGPVPNKGLGCYPGFKGKAYFEGWVGDSAEISSAKPDPDVYSDGGGYFGRELKLKVPSDMPDGNYRLMVEIYGSDNTSDKKGYIDNLNYLDENKAIARKKFDVIVGNPKSKIGIRNLSMQGTLASVISFKELVETKHRYVTQVPKDDLSYEVSLLGTNYKRTFSGDHSSMSNLWLPEPNEKVEKILQVVVKDNTGIVTYGFFPLRTNYRIDGRDHVTKHWFWEYDFPGLDFEERAVELRKQIYEEAAKNHGKLEVKVAEKKDFWWLK